MSGELFIHNSVGIIFMIFAIPVLGVITFRGVNFRNIRYRFTEHLLGFALWSGIILLGTDYLYDGIADLHIRYLSRTAVNLFGITLIALFIPEKTVSGY